MQINNTAHLSTQHTRTTMAITVTAKTPTPIPIDKTVKVVKLSMYVNS